MAASALPCNSDFAAAQQVPALRSHAVRFVTSAVGSFLLFAALWLKVRSDLPLVHFAITSPRLSPTPPA